MNEDTKEQFGNDYNSLGIKTSSINNGNNVGVPSPVGSKESQSFAGGVASATLISNSTKIGFDDGKGYWLGIDSDGKAKFFIGDSAGDKLTYDGTSLNISLASSGSIDISQSIGDLIINASGILFEVSSLVNANIILASGGSSFGSPVYPTTLRFVTGGQSGDANAVTLDFNATAVATGDFSPAATSNMNLGKSTQRFNTIYLVNSPDVVSDITLKDNIREVKYGLAEIVRITPIQYKMDGKEAIGFSAQEMFDIIPEIATKPEGDQKASIRPLELIPVLVKAIQELNVEINRLKEKML